LPIVFKGNIWEGIGSIIIGNQGERVYCWTGNSKVNEGGKKC